MRITFSQVQAFVSVASTGSFTRTAETLNLSQPALTTRIRHLEESLELRLFDRNTRTVQLTDAGRELHPIFLRLVNELENAVANAKEQSRKALTTIRFACLPSCAANFVPKHISKFWSDYPDATFMMEETVDDSIRKLVKDGDVDFGICALEGDDPDLVTDFLFEDRLLAVFRENHPLQHLQSLTIDAVKQYQLILPSEGSSVRHQVDRAFAAAGTKVSLACEVTHASSAIALVRSGLGVSVFPSTSAELNVPGIVSRPLDDKGFLRQLVLVRRKGGTLRKVVTDFIACVLDQKNVPLEG